MEFFKNLSETVTGAVDYIVEQNKKFNKVSKIKRLIKKESNFMTKAYITLGKHYYNELRDVPNYDMQKLCSSIDNSKKEIKRLKQKLEDINNEVNLADFESLVMREKEIHIEEPTSPSSDFDQVDISESDEKLNN